MKTHKNEDTLLELALGLLDVDSEKRVRTHLQKCPACLEEYSEIERSFRLIKEVTPKVSASISTLPSLRYIPYSWLRVAAILAVGFGLGFITSESFRSPIVTTVRQQIDPKPPRLPEVRFVVCDGIDLSQNSL
jgi:hypothetical protein